MGTLVTGIIVFGIAGIAAWRIYKNRKKGKCCGCDGSGCHR
ncbi:MAG: FeoB-associated Cys-rich membrane protein [Synergistaceae bacterium]|nr:FeoB-associated Cys-rich membrane protein [Synergistaceae bacterium]